MKVYVILSSLRLLKVNFHQMIKIGIKPQDLVYSSADEPDCDALLSRIKKVLFSLSDGTSEMNASPGEEMIRQESMQVMRVGFSLLFPSPIEQARFLGQLLKKDRYEQHPSIG